MKLSIEWLSELVSLDGITPVQCAEILTMTGSKVERISCCGDEIQNVVIGHILSVEKHPGADRLSVCRVDTGEGRILQIITAATNVSADDFVPVVLDGGLLPGGVKIKKGKMRGLESEGMLCGGSELGLTENDESGAGVDGILILSGGGWVVGQDIREALMLHDTTLEFEITNNRPDCMSIIGLARELAAALQRPLTLPWNETAAGADDMPPAINITVENPELCPRYSARMIKNVTIEPSPRWLRRRLKACGVRPINNIVDITNYVMLEYGQPMHAFDYACLEDGRLIVRNARPGEVLKTLDGNVRTLDESMLVIADPKGPTAVAGVMGGMASEITEKTAEIVFESANFNGPSVRKTALKLAMRTDASSRFEKGLDVNTTVTAVNRACLLIELLEAGETAGGLADVSVPLTAPDVIPFESEKINAYLGTDIPVTDMMGILNSLDFSVEIGAVTPPPFRMDVRIWQDVAEEVARLYGYDRIPVSLTASRSPGWLTPGQDFRRRITEICLAIGYYEMLTYSFIGPSDYDRVNLPKDSRLREGRALLNPLGEETSVMRAMALPSLMSSLARNMAYRNPSALLFEIAMVYVEEGKRLPKETPHLIMGGYGKDMDFAAIKGSTETLLENLGIKAAFRALQDPSYHPGRCAEILVRGEPVGVLGEIHPLVLRNYDMTGRVYACEMDTEKLFEARGSTSRYVPLPRYPAVRRDLALVCGHDQTHADITAVMKRSGGVLLSECELFDVYTDEKLGGDKKSLAYSLTFRAPDRTLRDEEVDDAVKKILETLERKMGIVIRS